MKLGVALTKAHLEANACSAYHLEACVAPLGRRLITISAPEAFRTFSTFTSGLVLILRMLSVDLPTPSKSGPLLTTIPVGGTSTTFGVLFGSAKIASDRSFPTFRSSTSKAATTSMSFGDKLPNCGFRNPTEFS